MKYLSFFMVCAIAISGCGGSSPSPLPTTQPVITSTQTQNPIDTIIIHPELNIITPENVTQIEQIARWGQGKIFDYAISPDKQTIAISMVDGIHLYNTATLEEKKYIERKISNTADLDLSYSLSFALPVSFSPDGKYLAFAGGIRGTQVWMIDLLSGEPIKTLVSRIPSFQISGIGISQDNSHIIVTSSGMYLPCDEHGSNYALYDISGEYAQFEFDRYFCTRGTSRFRFTENGKVYFFYWYIDGMLPYGMDIFDLNTMKVESSSFNPMGGNSEKAFYDVSPDGKVLASLEYRRALDYRDDEYITRLVEVQTGNVIQTINGRISFISSSDNSPAWKSWSEAHNNDNNCKITLDDSGRVEEIASSGNISTYAVYHVSNYPQAIESWDTTNCKRKGEISFEAASEILFSPDEKLLAVENGFNVDVWDVKTGKIRFIAIPTTVRLPIDRFTFSYDSNYLITGTYGQKSSFYPSHYYENYVVSIWDAQTGEKVRSLETNSNYLKNITSSPNAEIVALSDSQSINFWNIRSGQQLATIPTGIFAFSEDENRVWLATEGSTPSLVLYEIGSGKSIMNVPTSFSSIMWLQTNGDGSRLVLIVREQDIRGFSIVLINAETGAILQKTQAEKGSYEVASNNTIFATYGSNGYIDLWNLQTALPFQRIHGYHTIEGVRNPDQFYFGSDNFVRSIEIFSTNNVLVSLNTDNNLRFWDIQSGNLVGEVNPYFEITDFKISPDGRLIILVGTDGLMRIWGVKGQ